MSESGFDGGASRKKSDLKIWSEKQKPKNKQLEEMKETRLRMEIKRQETETTRKISELEKKLHEIGVVVERKSAEQIAKEQEISMIEEIAKETHEEVITEVDRKIRQRERKFIEQNGPIEDDVKDFSIKYGGTESIRDVASFNNTVIDNEKVQETGLKIKNERLDFRGTFLTKARDFLIKHPRVQKLVYTSALAGIIGGVVQTLDISHVQAEEIKQPTKITERLNQAEMTIAAKAVFNCFSGHELPGEADRYKGQILGVEVGKNTYICFGPEIKQKAWMNDPNIGKKCKTDKDFCAQYAKCEPNYANFCKYLKTGEVGFINGDNKMYVIGEEEKDYYSRKGHYSMTVIDANGNRTIVQQPIRENNFNKHFFRFQQTDICFNYQANNFNAVHNGCEIMGVYDKNKNEFILLPQIEFTGQSEQQRMEYKKEIAKQEMKFDKCDIFTTKSGRQFGIIRDGFCGFKNDDVVDAIKGALEIYDRIGILKNTTLDLISSNAYDNLSTFELSPAASTYLALPHGDLIVINENAPLADDKFIEAGHLIDEDYALNRIKDGIQLDIVGYEKTVYGIALCNKALKAGLITEQERNAIVGDKNKGMIFTQNYYIRKVKALYPDFDLNSVKF